jgi:hypothetical protein
VEYEQHYREQQLKYLQKKAARRRFRKEVRRLWVVNSSSDFFLQWLYISFLETLCEA